MWEASSLPPCLSLTGMREQRGVYGGTCVFGPACKHPSELSSWQFVRNGGALKTITPHCVTLQVFYYFNDRQHIAREQTQAPFIYTHM